MKKFNVINYDINKGEFKAYDIVPYFVNIYNDRKKKSKGKKIQKILRENPNMKKYYGVPDTFEEFQEFIKQEGRYQFWSRCEYEIILVDWPCQKVEDKWDIYDQIMMNLDIITDIIMEECKSSKRTKKSE